MEKFENGAWFLRQGLLFAVSKRELIAKTLFKQEEFENAGFDGYSVDGDIMIFPSLSFNHTQMHNDR